MPVSDVRSTIRSSERTLPRQRQTRLNEAQVQSLIGYYQFGETIADLARKYGIHRVTVYEHLGRNGIPHRSRGLTDAQVDAAVLLYEQGSSLAKLGTRFEVDAQTVRRYLAAQGTPIRKRQRP